MVNKLWSRKKGGYVEANGAKPQNFQLPANLREFAISIMQMLMDLSQKLTALSSLLLNETKVYTSKAINIKGYQSIPVVRKARQGGGIFIGDRHGSYETVMVGQGDDADFVTVRLKHNREGIRLILAYGPQENDPEINRNLFYQNLSIQIEQAFLSGDSVIMVGDFNAKLGKDVIGGDVHPMSPNGKILFSLCNKYNLFVLNSTNMCKGVFTRIHNYRNKVE